VCVRVRAWVASILLQYCIKHAWYAQLEMGQISVLYQFMRKTPQNFAKLPLIQNVHYNKTQCPYAKLPVNNSSQKLFFGSYLSIYLHEVEQIFTRSVNSQKSLPFKEPEGCRIRRSHTGACEEICLAWHRCNSNESFNRQPTFHNNVTHPSSMLRVSKIRNRHEAGRRLSLKSR
jgi:hypothetical protein